VIGCCYQTVLSTSIQDLSYWRKNADKGVHLLSPVEGCLDKIVFGFVGNETLMFLVSETTEDNFLEKLMEAILLLGYFLSSR